MYGRKEHGTTGIPPMEAFEEERQKLRALPAERFQVAVWKQVPVHSGDQFLTFLKQTFSLPPKWRGKSVWARYVQPLVQLFDGEKLIRQYVVRPGVTRYWQPEDFPLETREMMNGGYPAWLMQKAREYGTDAVALIHVVLQPHAYLNARRARGMLDVMKAHHGRPYFPEVCVRARNPRGTPAGHAETNAGGGGEVSLVAGRAATIRDGKRNGSRHPVLPGHKGGGP